MTAFQNPGHVLQPISATSASLSSTVIKADVFSLSRALVGYPV